MPVNQAYKHSDITDKILKAFYVVYGVLGYGFLEKVYENALGIELERQGMKVVRQARIEICYTGHIVGEYFADMLVNECVIVEIKAVQTLQKEHESQLINYLKATPFEVGLLLNFGPQPQRIRKVFDNPRKGWWVEISARKQNSPQKSAFSAFFSVFSVPINSQERLHQSQEELCRISPFLPSCPPAQSRSMMPGLTAPLTAASPASRPKLKHARAARTLPTTATSRA